MTWLEAVLMTFVLRFISFASLFNLGHLLGCIVYAAFYEHFVLELLGSLCILF